MYLYEIILRNLKTVQERGISFLIILLSFKYTIYYCTFFEK